MTPSPQAAAARASLPITYSAVSGARVSSVSGHDGWPVRAAGALAERPDSVIVVERPVAADTGCLDGLESRVVLDSAWGHSSAVPALRGLLAHDRGEVLLAHVHVPASHVVSHWALEGLLLLDEVVGVDALTLLDHVEDRFLANGRTREGTRLSITAARGEGEQGGIQILDASQARTVTADFGDPRIARPARIAVATSSEVTSLATPWETASRGAWREAARLAGAPAGEGASDLSVFRRMVEHFSASGA